MTIERIVCVLVNLWSLKSNFLCQLCDLIQTPHPFLGSSYIFDYKMEVTG